MSLTEHSLASYSQAKLAQVALGGSTPILCSVQ